MRVIDAVVNRSAVGPRAASVWENAVAALLGVWPAVVEHLLGKRFRRHVLNSERPCSPRRPSAWLVEQHGGLRRRTKRGGARRRRRGRRLCPLGRLRCGSCSDP